MRTIVFLLIFLSAPILLSTCGEDYLHVCGDYVNTILKWEATAKTYPWNDPTWSTYLKDGNRIFEVRSEVYSNVCPDNNIKIYTTAKFSYYPDDKPMRMSVKYCYGESGEYGSYENIFNSFGWYWFEFTFSIDDAYKRSPGEFYLYVRWEIVDAKDVDTDFNFFKDRFSDTMVSMSYYKY